MKLQRTGLSATTWLLALLAAVLCCAALTGCDRSVDQINIYDISINPPVMNIQSGVTKPLIVTIEPYFASDMGVIFVKGDDPDGLVKLENHRMIQPWEFAIDVTSTGSNEGKTSITVMTLDGEIKKNVQVNKEDATYKLTVRNLNAGTLNENTTATGELVSWKGGLYAGTPLTVRNAESGANVGFVPLNAGDAQSTGGTCFPNATIVYLTHDDGTPIKGSFTWRMKFSMGTSGSTSGSTSGNGMFFGVYLDPTVDPTKYQDANPHLAGRFRVEGMRFRPGDPNGDVRAIHTTNGYSNANPRVEGDTFSVPVADVELEIFWDGVGRWTNRIIYPDTDGRQPTKWDTVGGSGNQSMVMELADSNGSYYPAFHIAGVTLNITELSIAE